MPVMDVGIMAHDYSTLVGSAMAMGERSPIAAINAAAAASMALGEALLNIQASGCVLQDVALSANWMCNAKATGEGTADVWH